MTPEQRAAKIIKDANRGWDWQVTETREQEVAEAIAAAIREAKNDVIDLAARIVSENAEVLDSHNISRSTLRNLAWSIQNLKAPTP